MPSTTSRKLNMNVSKMSSPEVSSYAGAVVAMASSVTLTQIGVVVGIITALLTFAMNAYYTYHKNKRESRLADLEAREREVHLMILEQQNVPKS